MGAFNLVGTTDLIVNYYHAIKVGLPALAGQFGAVYVVPILYVPNVNDHAYDRFLFSDPVLRISSFKRSPLK